MCLTVLPDSSESEFEEDLVRQRGVLDQPQDPHTYVCHRNKDIVATGITSVAQESEVVQATKQAALLEGGCEVAIEPAAKGSGVASEPEEVETFEGDTVMPSLDAPQSATNVPDESFHARRQPTTIVSPQELPLSLQHPTIMSCHQGPRHPHPESTTMAFLQKSPHAGYDFVNVDQEDILHHLASLSSAVSELGSHFKAQAPIVLGRRDRARTETLLDVSQPSAQRLKRADEFSGGIDACYY